MHSNPCPYRKRLLAAAVGGTIALGTVAAAQAGPLFIRPAGESPAVANQWGTYDLNTFFEVAGWRGSSVNNNLNPVGTDIAGDQFETNRWGFTINTGDGTLSNGDTFNEIFSMHWDVMCDTFDFTAADCVNSGGFAEVGDPEGPPGDFRETHLFLRLQLAGTVQNVNLNGSADPNDFDFGGVYTSARGLLFFDSDGITDDPNPDGNAELIATFGFADGGGTLSDNFAQVGSEAHDISLTMELNCAVPGRLADGDTSTDVTVSQGGTTAACDDSLGGLLNSDLLAAHYGVLQFVFQGINRVGAHTHVAGNTLQYTFNADAASGRGAFVNVPEPATVALMGLGLVGLGAARRNRKRNAG